jgi:hypothetical protein
MKVVNNPVPLGTLQATPPENGVLERGVLEKFLKSLREKADEHSSFIQGFKSEQEEGLGFPEIGDEGMRDGGSNDDRRVLVKASKNELAKAMQAIRRIENDLLGPKRSTYLVPFGKCLKPNCGRWIEPERLETIPDEPVCLGHCGCVGDGKSHRN